MWRGIRASVRLVRQRTSIPSRGFCQSKGAHEICKEESLVVASHKPFRVPKVPLIVGFLGGSFVGLCSFSSLTFALQCLTMKITEDRMLLGPSRAQDDSREKDAEHDHRSSLEPLLHCSSTSPIAPRFSASCFTLQHNLPLGTLRSFLDQLTRLW